MFRYHQSCTVASKLGLGNIACCPEDTSILNATEDSDSGENSDEDDDQEINHKHEAADKSS